MKLDRRYILTLIAILVALGCVPSPAISKETRSAIKKTNFLDLGGRLVFNVDSQVTVPTKLGNVSCAPGSTVFVFANQRGITVFNFDSLKKEDVRVFVGKRQVLLRPAEQFVVSQTVDSKFDDINPGLGIIHKKPQLVDVGNTMTGYIAEFSLISGISKVPLLNKMASSNKPKEKQVIERILKNAAILQSSAERLLRKRPAQPTGTVAQLIESGQKLAGQQILRGGVEQFALGQHQNVDMRIAECRNKGFERAAGLSWLELADGEWKERNSQSDNNYEVAGIFSCPIDTVVQTELGNVECKKGSIVFIVNREDTMTVCTLDSPHLDDVNLVIASHPKLRLAPGRQIVLTRDTESAFDKANPAHLIGYRDDKEIGNVDGIKVVRTDFSITSAMMTIQPLRKLVTSPDTEKNRIAESIIKNSAILWGLTSNQGIFHPAK